MGAAPSSPEIGDEGAAPMSPFPRVLVSAGIMKTVVALLFSLFMGQAAWAQVPDTVLVNGKILTVEDQKRLAEETTKQVAA